mgnify:CR=1 FL=1
MLIQRRRLGHKFAGSVETLECVICGVSDEKLWQFRIDSTHNLVDFARRRLSRQLAVAGSPTDEIESAKHLFDPNILTLGFARRFATYKLSLIHISEPTRPY